MRSSARHGGLGRCERGLGAHIGTRLLWLALAGASLTGCGSLLQSHAVGNGDLTGLVSFNRFPIYWVGGTFKKVALTSVDHELGGAYSLQYGDCSVGGQAVCIAPLQIVTTPEASLPTESQSGASTVSERGVSGRVSEGGRTIQLATGHVVIDIYAQTPAMAWAAAASVTPINRIGTPSSTLPAPAPHSREPAAPLSGQLPHGLQVVHRALHQSGPRTSSGPTGPSDG